MAVVVLPIDADPATGLPSYTAQQTREAFAALMPWAPSARPVGANSGVRLGTSPTTVTASLSTWSVASHAGVIDAESAALAGPYMYATDGTDTGAMTAPNVSNPRVDIVYVTINDTVQDGSGLRSGVVGYLAGTPAGSPTAPATPARSLLLATILVPISGGGSPTVTWAAAIFGAMARGRIDKTTSQNIANVTDVQMTFQSANTSQTTLAGMNDAANNRLICQVSGLHLITCQIPWDGSSTGAREAKIQVNGNNIAQDKINNNAGWAGYGGDPHLFSIPYFLNKGDLVTVQVGQNSGATVAIDASGGVIGFLSAVCLSG